jgi:hypothetical protein
MTPQFNNLNELTTYLGSLETRLKTLEAQNETLRSYIAEQGSGASAALPKTNLLSKNFLMRAFTVWGHMFVAQLIISAPIFCIYLIFIYSLFQQIGHLVPTP